MSLSPEQLFNFENATCKDFNNYQKEYIEIQFGSSSSSVSQIIPKIFEKRK